MVGTVVFLGAGATKSAGGPLTSEILPLILQGKGTQGAATDPGGARLNLLEQFLNQRFHVTAASPAELYPSLPLLMSLLDTALDHRQSFDQTWTFDLLRQLREAVELAIFDLLEEKLNSAPTSNHYVLLDKIYGRSSDPCIISTNYDLMIDTALMFYSQGASVGARLPNYACQIRTEFYREESPHYGTLLKLHGSLNWLHCKTCHRLEIGASESKKFLTALAKLAGPTLEQSYTPDGSPCPTCGTKLRPLLIAPTHLKDYRNPHIAQIWCEAERVLREANRVIFIGYSLPDDDVEVIYLLKRGLSHLSPAAITVVQNDSSKPLIQNHPVGRRYRTLFGDGLDWHPEGIDLWLNDYAIAQ